MTSHMILIFSCLKLVFLNCPIKTANKSRHTYIPLAQELMTRFPRSKTATDTGTYIDRAFYYVYVLTFSR